jgi:hypothetical protein
MLVADTIFVCIIRTASSIYCATNSGPGTLVFAITNAISIAVYRATAVICFATSRRIRANVTGVTYAIYVSVYLISVWSVWTIINAIADGVVI